jgi:hypothetical protein
MIGDAMPRNPHRTIILFSLNNFLQHRLLYKLFPMTALLVFMKQIPLKSGGKLIALELTAIKRFLPVSL